MLCSSEVKQLALQVGLHDCGLAKATADDTFAQQLQGWLHEGCHADMAYMATHCDMRADPRLLVPNAATVVSVVLAYKPTHTMHSPYRIAQYAYGEDYHITLKRMLWELLSLLKRAYPSLDGRPFVDTAPISDKVWAWRAGLGRIGYHTMFVHPQYGSYCNLGELVLCEEADHYDSPLPEDFLQCANCRRCIQACPNGALQLMEKSSYYRLDARLCNAYNTIENRSEHLSEQLHLSGYAFGCDCCQTACPHNQKVLPVTEVDTNRIHALEELHHADEATFKKVAKHSALSRIRFSQWRRNIAAIDQDHPAKSSSSTPS